MKRSLGLVLLVLLLSCWMLHLGSGLKCYTCSDNSEMCARTECEGYDACLSLTETGGKTTRQCIKYTECKHARVAQMFPTIRRFTFECCQSDLCNSGPS